MQIQIITNCPSCDSLLERVNDQLFCRNTNCEAKTNKKVLHYIKALKIKGLGERTVDKLGISSISDIYAQLNDSDRVSSIIGEKLAAKLVAEIKLAKTVQFSTYLSAFGIPLVGKTIATKLSDVVSSVEGITLQACKKAGVGDKASANLVEWASTYIEENPVTIVNTITPRKAFSHNICITGKIDGYSRTQLKDLLETKGLKLVSAVSGTTNYLVTEDTSKASSKIKKAESLGISIISFKELQSIMENI